MEAFNFNIDEQQTNSNSISINRFSITIDSKVLFDDSSLTLNPKNVYGLIGKNGCGKTTLLNFIESREIPSDPNMLILYVKQEIEETDETPLQILLESNGKFNKLQKRSDEIEILLENDVEDDIIEEYENIQNELSNYNEELELVKITRILFGLGFNEHTIQQSYNLFSGGWKMRISIARSLYIEPDLLLLDEPTNHLDLETVIWLGNYLNELMDRTNIIVLLVSHNIGFLNMTTTNILNIEDNKLINYKGNYDKFRRTLKMKERNNEKEWDKLKKKKKKMSKKDFEELLKQSECKEPEKKYEVSIKFLEAPYHNSSLVSFQKLNFSYEDNIIFNDASFGLDIDSRVVLLGKNGSGKSTLLKLIVGELQPDINTEMYISGKTRIAYYHQHFENFLPGDLTPVDFLSSHIPEELSHQNPQQLIRRYLGCMKLEAQAHTSPIETLSGGQKARVAMVYLIFQKPNLILFDEPTNHLDIETIEALIEALKEYNGGVMIITHEPQLVMELDYDLWLLKDNKINRYMKSFEDYIEEHI